MHLIGLTGGIGMGKTAAAEILRRQGILICDTDEVARQVVEPGQPALAEIQKQFGPEYIGQDGRLRRDEMARRVFNNPEARKCLEAILHPRIRSAWLEEISRWRTRGVHCGVVVIPLLFETKAEVEFGKVLCVVCSAATQQKRLLARGWSATQAQERIQAQMPVEKKMALANYVIWSEGGLDVLQTQLHRVLG